MKDHSSGQYMLVGILPSGMFNEIFINLASQPLMEKVLQYLLETKGQCFGFHKGSDCRDVGYLRTTPYQTLSKRRCPTATSIWTTRKRQIPSPITTISTPRRNEMAAGFAEASAGDL